MRRANVVDSRKTLEREADSLGIPWTFATSDKELSALVQSRKESAMSQDIPSCFGICWEAVGQSVCMGCSIKDPCRHKFALGRLKEARASLGAKVTIEALCAATGVQNSEAIMAAIEYAAGHGEPPLKVAAPSKKPTAEAQPEVVPPDAPSDIPPPPDSVEADAIPPPPGEDAIENTMFDDPDLENRRLKYAPDPKPPADESPPPVEEKPVTETKAKKAPKVKKSKKAAPSSHPQKAGPAKRASGPALAKAKRSAPTATALESPRQKWGEHTWAARWQRERERSKEIASLNPGMMLRPRYKGVEYKVQVVNSGYRYQSHRYPTLSAVLVEILGTYRDPRPLPRGKYRTPTYSAPKFFKAAIQEATGR